LRKEAVVVDCSAEPPPAEEIVVPLPWLVIVVGTKVTVVLAFLLRALGNLLKVSGFRLIHPGPRTAIFGGRLDGAAVLSALDSINVKTATATKRPHQACRILVGAGLSVFGAGM
jgi:hypothetical protein